jgi:hypothetical protein
VGQEERGGERECGGRGGAKAPEDVRVGCFVSADLCIHVPQHHGQMVTGNSVQEHVELAVEGLLIC